MEPFHYCEIPDSFVHNCNKLTNGKNGHGEARLFISSSEDIQMQVLEKPWKIEFCNYYLSDIDAFIRNTNNFKKNISTRINDITHNISAVNNRTIHVKSQNGTKDCRRNYVGVKIVYCR